MAVASAGLYACLHLASDRQPHQHPTTRFLQARSHSCRPTNSVKALKASWTYSNCRVKSDVKFAVNSCRVYVFAGYFTPHQVFHIMQVCHVHYTTYTRTFHFGLLYQYFHLSLRSRVAEGRYFRCVSKDFTCFDAVGWVAGRASGL